jgi:two-component system response regulator TctD
MSLDGAAVLLVEDNDLLGELIEQRLLKAGATVDWVRDGGGALQAAALRRPQTILLDLNLPDTPGLALAVSLRAIEGMRNISIFSMSAAPRAPDPDLLRSACIRRHFIKPFDFSTLVTAIHAAIQGPPD